MSLYADSSLRIDYRLRLRGLPLRWHSEITAWEPLGWFVDEQRRAPKQQLDVLGCVRHTCLTMKTATVRDLRNRFPRVAAWITQGQSVEITRAGKAFARLVPALAPKRRRFKMPDIMARLDGTYGHICYDAGDTATGLAASRGDRS
jgi:antitoxin (DNA-binding transcriptional repressor) of toxin-antitoxin stability system